ncbi:MAG: 30S ribosome-binding factor RbfA [Solirubrobacteraceae bacterium]|nr:30S ribosome-binding factor RbfA [Solirubrobacteraceae bacterium]
MASKRMRRVDGSVREVLATALARDVTDPGIGFVTFTSVETSGDLRHAKVFVSVLGDADEQQESLNALNRAKRLLQSSLSHDLRLKYTPVLEFYLDDSARRAVRLEALLTEPEPDEDGTAEAAEKPEAPSVDDVDDPLTTHRHDRYPAPGEDES